MAGKGMAEEARTRTVGEAGWRLSRHKADDVGAEPVAEDAR